MLAVVALRPKKLRAQAQGGMLGREDTYAMSGEQDQPRLELL